MQKRLVRAPGQHGAPPVSWLAVENLAQVELTSEDPAHPIEAAFRGGESGWRASEPGSQSIRLIFHQPQPVTRIRLRFVEPTAERTQEFSLRWSPDGGRSFQELVRQQYTFSPGGATSEIEEYGVDLAAVTALELTIIPDQGRGQARASLAEWQLA
ncbi:MAG: carbohydrate-binding protein [Gemmatimonadales bacterium]